MANKKKRRLTKEEIEEVMGWFESSSIGRKPTIRQIAKRYGVNQPSVVKSLGGWRGVQRGKPVPPPKFKPRHVDMSSDSPVKIPLYESKLDIQDVNKLN